jgi:putative ABC transport system permease protein
LAKVNPLVVLKKTVFTKVKGGLGKILLVLQLIICFAALCSTLIISQQFKLLMKKDLGFNSDNIMTIFVQDQKVVDQLKQIKNELKKEDCIKNVSTSSHTFDRLNEAQWEFYIKSENTMQAHLLNACMVDEEFINLHEIKILKGRNFDNKRLTDETSCIVNEALVSKLGWGDNALNKEIFMNRDGNNPMKVIGIVKDFHFESLHTELGPFIFFSGNNRRSLNFKYKKGTEQIALNKIKRKLSEFGSVLPADISFLNEKIKKKYKEESNFMKLFRIFTFMAIFISIIGIIGLTSYKAQRQLLDIAIKKVLGATLNRIFTSYIYSIMKLFAISILIALPAIYYFMYNWLNNFSYRININPYHFLFSAVLILVIIIISTILSLSNVIYVDPVKLLKDE